MVRLSTHLFENEPKIALKSCLFTDETLLTSLAGALQ